MARAHGQDLICPDDGGLLVGHADWFGRLWCPNARHGGNGLFLKPTDADVGVPVQRDAPRPATMADLAEAGARAAAREKEAAAAEAKIRRDNDQTTRPRRQRGTPRDCKCGCGEQTKGGTFRPGHDARFYAANGGHK